MAWQGRIQELLVEGDEVISTAESPKAARFMVASAKREPEKCLNVKTGVYVSFRKFS
jgi:hypothetical protein